MSTLNLRFIGTSPILLHRVCKHEFRDQIASHAKADSDIEDEILEKMSKDEQGRPVVPVSWIWDAFRRGRGHVVIDGQQISLRRLEGMMHLPAGPIALLSPDGTVPQPTVYQGVQHAKPGSKRMIAVVAPMFKEWTLDVQMTVRPSFLGELPFEKICREAGRCGIGLFHPPKKHFGTFRILQSHAKQSPVVSGASGSSFGAGRLNLLADPIPHRAVH